MPSVAHARCFNHAGREAVARCPSCRRTFCRECVSEHDGRVLCAPCLAKSAQPAAAAGSRLPAVRGALGAAAGLLAAWFFFYLVGRGLLLIPTEGHSSPSTAEEESE